MCRQRSYQKCNSGRFNIFSSIIQASATSAASAKACDWLPKVRAQQLSRIKRAGQCD